MHQHFNTRCAAVWKKPFPDAATKARKKCSSSAEHALSVSLSLATRLYLTIVEDTPQQADAFFPLTANEVECLNQAGWKKVKEETHNEGKLTFRFVDLEKCLKNVKIKTTNHAEKIIRF